jgi:hypothetical protein
VSKYFYKEPGTLTTILSLLLLLGIVFSAFAALSDYWEYELLQTLQQGGDYTDEQIDQNDSRQALVAIVQVRLLLFTAIIFGMWTYRMSWNAHSIDESSMEISPGWAVGYYFIPVVNLWKPYSAIKDTFKTFTSQEEPISGGSALGFWWFCWIVSNILGRVVFRLSMRTETVEELMQSTLFTLASDLFDILLHTAALMMVITLSRVCAGRFDKQHDQSTMEWMQQEDW